MDQIVHVEDNRKFVFYVVDKALVGAVFCNKLHLFSTNLFKPVYNCFESTEYQRLIEKCKRKFGIGEVVKHTSWLVTLEKPNTKTINLQSFCAMGDASHDNTADVIKLFTE